jgi:hypothetical protein
MIRRIACACLAVAPALAILAFLPSPMDSVPYAGEPASYTATNDCDTDSSCAALPQCALKPGCNGGPDSEPFRLVGYGCDGAPGPLYRDEENEFPACERIEALW